MTREARHVLMRFAGWAILGGVVVGGLSLWLRSWPVIGAAAQFALLVALVLFSLQLARDTKRMERERHEFERLRLECEQEQLAILRATTDRAHVIADAVLRTLKEANPPQVDQVEIRPKDWLQ